MNQPIATTVIPSPMGPLRAAATHRGISQLEFTDRKKATARSPVTNPHLKKLRAELDCYFAGKLREFTVPVDPSGTPFRERVWKRLCGIPYGETISYKELASRVGNKKASRAVGGANGANAVCILIPCHRVIAADGSLGGYSAGVRRKERLLALERDGVLPPK